MDLDALRAQLTNLENENPQSDQTKGLRAFIANIERLPEGSVLMGKIMQSPLSFAQKDLLRNARDINQITSAFGAEYNVSVE